MKILIPVIGFGHSGGYRVLSELANNWKMAGHEVDFVSYHLQASPYFKTTAGIIWVDVHGIPTIKNNQDTPRRITFVLENLIALYRAVKLLQSEYDLILANHSLTALPVRLGGMNHHNNLAYYIQAYEPEYYLKNRNPLAPTSLMLYALSKISYELDLYQICNSPTYLGHKNIKASEWVPPGIDLDKFYPKVTHKDFSMPGDIILGCIGRTEPVKGTRYVLDAFIKLNEINKRFKLNIAYGNVPEDWHHPDAFITHPRNDEELAAYYRSIDIIISPGTVQLGAPHYPVMEAMASGTPVIHTGYMPGTNENSWVVRTHNTNDIIEAVLEITNGTQYLKKVKSALNNIQQFSWANVANDMISKFSSRSS